MAFLDRFFKGKKDEDGEDGYTPFASGFREILNSLNENAEEDMEEYPDDADVIQVILNSLRYQCRYRYGERRGGEHSQPLDAEARFFLSDDRMKAYACLLPPDNGGMDMDMEHFLSDMQYEGVCFGLMEKQASSYVEDQRYLHIFPIARGKRPRSGKAGEVKELFQRRRAVSLDVAAEAVIDFSAYAQVQAISKGDVICRIRQPVPGEDGTDVTGGRLPCVPTPPLHIPAGLNTRVTRDGQALVAAMDGVLFTRDDCFYVQQQKVINGSLDGYQDVLRIEGDLCITGNVSGGVRLEVSGDVIIYGEVRDAYIISGGTIRIQRGVYGMEGATYFSTVRQFQASSIERAVVISSGDVIAEVIRDSVIHCKGTVNAKGGRGLIAGGDIQASALVICRRIGNLSGNVNRIMVGCSTTVLDRQEQIQKELLDGQEVLEKLRKYIGDLRMAGSHLSMDKRRLLAQLSEQRMLYEQQQERLREEQKQIKSQLQSAAEVGRVQCQEMYPTTVIQIGEWKQEFRQQATGCNIRCLAGQIVLR